MARPRARIQQAIPHLDSLIKKEQGQGVGDKAHGSFNVLFWFHL